MRPGAPVTRVPRRITGGPFPSALSSFAVHCHRCKRQSPLPRGRKIISETGSPGIIGVGDPLTHAAWLFRKVALVGAPDCPVGMCRSDKSSWPGLTTIRMLEPKSGEVARIDLV